MKREAPAAARNRAPIADVLAEELPARGRVLEVASGTGEHAVYFANRFPALEWQPSDPDADARASIEAWRKDAGLANLLAPIAIDASAGDVAAQRADAIVCINMVHISPVAATQGLVKAAGEILPPGAPLILYGPYIEQGVETAPSNLGFDQSLKARNPEWGLREVSWLDELAQGHGLVRERRVALPANNIMLVYRKTG